MVEMRPHIPVLLQEVLNDLHPQANKTYIDGTFGAGGYSRAILEKAPCYLIAFDRDPAVLPHAKKLAEDYPHRFRFIQACFGSMTKYLLPQDIDNIGGIVLDIGVSSMQIDQALRGFSFQQDGPLDMRMEQEGETAADMLAVMDEGSLAEIFYRCGEERHAKRIAGAIIAAREVAPITRTHQLTEVILRAAKGTPMQRKDSVVRCFQALRIAVNDELGELERGLHQATELLEKDGRLVVVSFHSLEDRMIKQFMRRKAGEDVSHSRHVPLPTRHTSDFYLMRKKALSANDDEIVLNPRSRSAKLRCLVRKGVQHG